MPSTTFPDDVATEIAAAFADVNGHHADTVAFVARHTCADALDGVVLVEAELLGADPDGIELALTTEVGERRLTRIPFGERASNIDDVQALLFGTLLEARAAAGDAVPLTSLESELAETGSIPVHRVVLGERRPLTRNLIEVDVRSEAALPRPAADTFYYALWPTEPGALHEGYGLADHQAQGPDGPVLGAYYTVRRTDPAAGTTTLWVQLHGPDGVGAALAAAEPGTSFALWGPRTGFEPDADAAGVVLVADETGLAACASIIEHLPGSTRVVGVFDVADRACRPPMPDHPGLEVTWTHRDGREPGTGTQLVDAVRAADLDGDGWWAFGAAESRQVTAVRQHLRGERGWPAGRVFMTGYWRRGT